MQQKCNKHGNERSNLGLGSNSSMEVTLNQLLLYVWPQFPHQTILVFGSTIPNDLFRLDRL